MNKTKLLELSQALCNALKVAQAECVTAEETLLEAEDGWSTVYGAFIQDEAGTQPPGGGRWNDEKRLAYVKENEPHTWARLQKAKSDVRLTKLQLDHVQAEISNLNRVLRIYELDVANANLNMALQVSGLSYSDDSD